jgi:GDP-L-fucose synthase
MRHYSDYGFLNVGTGVDIPIAEFAEVVSRIVGYKGTIAFDPSRPDGPPQKLLDVSRLKALGWAPKILLQDGLSTAYADFLSGAGRSAA